MQFRDLLFIFLFFGNLLIPSETILYGFQEDSENRMSMVYDVIVIGGGPSGLAVSAGLGGLTPYFEEKRLFDGDVQKLAQTIISRIPEEDRRSENPVTLAVNYLRDNNQVSFVKENSSLRFVVLTEGEVGGCWPEMVSNMECLSPVEWMALPGMDFPLTQYERPSMKEVSDYYQTYAREMELAEHIQTQTKVSSAERVGNVWQIHATQKGQEVSYQSKAVILAIGSYSVPKRLGIVGEDLTIVTHRLPTEITPNSRVLVVGSGLTAGEGVLRALESGAGIIKDLFSINFHLVKGKLIGEAKPLLTQRVSLMSFVMLQ